MSFKSRVTVIFLFVCCILTCFGRSGFAEDKGRKQLQDNDFLGLIPLHKVKTIPGPYDWMAINREAPQSYADYVKSDFKAPDARRKFIYITLLGDFDAKRRKIVKDAARYIEVYFGLPVKYIDPIDRAEIPDAKTRVNPQTGDFQILSTYILEDVLMPKLPKDAFCLIAFSAKDLWPGAGWNFVFGQASIDDRVGVWSIYRYGDPNKGKDDYARVLARTIKTGTHEIGHMFGLHHCAYYECNLNGSNHMKESDRRPLALCPIDLRKLQYNTGFDLKKRFERLIEISDDLGVVQSKNIYVQSLEVM